MPTSSAPLPARLAGRIRASALPALAALALGAAALFADNALAASGAPAPINALIFGSFSSTNSDSEGALIAAQFDLSGYSVNSHLTQSTGIYSTGNITLSNGQINGDVVSLGAMSLDGAGVTGARLPGADWSGLPSWLSDQRSLFTGVSAALASSTPTGSTTLTSYSGLVLTGDGTATTQFFTIDASDLSQATSLTISGLSAGQGLVLNVRGAHATLANLDVSTTLGAYDTVLNFADASDVSINAASPHAVVLAPTATIFGANGHIDGLVIAASWQASLQLHDSAASALVSVASPSAVPEAPTTAAAALGLAGIGLAVRRRRAQQG